MSCVIQGVASYGLAYKSGILPGDVLKAINGEPVVDFVDYEYLSCDKRLFVSIERDGILYEYVFDNKDGLPLGLDYECKNQEDIRRCRNKCLFCFVDQLPDGMRGSLYVKDDDWRMSFSLGNYVTLTNVDEQELNRIIKRRASPLYVSVHAAESDAYKKLLGVDGDIIKKLKRFAENGLYFHAQAVICPGINDGDVLKHTIYELAGLRPYAMTLAVVPVGLTRHRDGLYPLTPFDKIRAQEALKIIQDASIRLGGFVYAADELYIKAGMELPSYENSCFEQLENGVGMIRLFEHQALRAAEDIKRRRHKDIAIITGEDAAPVLNKTIDIVKPRGSIDVYPIVNEFFGRGVTVAGLVTGRDIALQIGRCAHKRAVIPACMLKDGMFLDDMSVNELSARIGAEITVVNTDGESFVNAIT